jgi:hypothetical protein
VIDSARHQWEEGRRRVEEQASDRRRYRDLMLLVDAIVDELRKQVGTTFTVAELADAYVGAEVWVRDVVADATPPEAKAGQRDSVLVQDAAFASYARGAIDYVP